MLRYARNDVLLKTSNNLILAGAFGLVEILVGPAYENMEIFGITYVASGIAAAEMEASVCFFFAGLELFQKIIL